MRKISEIAKDIYDDWGGKVNYAAAPYLNAMLTIDNVDDSYYHDSVESVILRFLANAGSWRGEKARAIKLELKSML